MPQLAGEVAEVGRLVADHWRGGIQRRASAALSGPARIVSRAVEGAGRPAGALVARQSRSLVDADEDLISGQELLRRSADVSEEEGQHPAFRRILTEITPDEARVIRLLCLEGAQPVVDVKRGWPPGTRVESANLTMLGADAGCRRSDRVPAYLNNLTRLGLITVSDRSVADPLRYQLLEVQPEVAAAIESAGRTGRTARKRLELTPFGIDFAVACMSLEPYGGE